LALVTLPDGSGRLLFAAAAIWAGTAAADLKSLLLLPVERLMPALALLLLPVLLLLLLLVLVRVLLIIIIIIKLPN
jgi:hypothetical protein